jgi:hypothetical protein
LIRYLLHNSELIQDRLRRNNGIELLSFLLQRLPRRFVDIHLLRACQELVTEAQRLPDKSLLNEIYEYIVFEFRIWNKADYEIRIGHIQYISTIIKDDKRYFRKKYGVQFFLDVIRTYFNKQSTAQQQAQNSSSNEQPLVVIGTPSHAASAELGPNMSDEDLRNLRNSFFGLIKYYAQKEIKINEINAILSFISATYRNCGVSFQCSDILDMLIALLEAPGASNYQLYLLMFEPNMADGLYSLLVQTDVDEIIQTKSLKLIRILLKTKKINDKDKSRLRLEDCGGYSGLISKLLSEHNSAAAKLKLSRIHGEYLACEMLENILIDEPLAINNYDNVWHIVSLLSISNISASPNSFELSVTDLKGLILVRLKICEMLVRFLFTSQNSLRLLTKTPAWQDILCQLLCIQTKRQSVNSGTGKQNSTMPPSVVVSTSSTGDLKEDKKREEQKIAWSPNNSPREIGEPTVASSDNESQNNDYESTGDVQEDEDEWENLNIERSQAIYVLNKNKKQAESSSLLSDRAAVNSTSENNDQLVTSTPSPNKKRERNQIMNKSTNSKRKESKQLTSTALKLTAIRNNIESQTILNSNNQNLMFDAKLGDLSGIQLSIDGDSNQLKTRNENNTASGETDERDVNLRKDSTSDESLVELLNGQESTELWEKVIYLLFKLAWDGITGSGEDAWKVRFAYFWHFSFSFG